MLKEVWTWVWVFRLGAVCWIYINSDTKLQVCGRKDASSEIDLKALSDQEAKLNKMVKDFLLKWETSDEHNVRFHEFLSGFLAMNDPFADVSGLSAP